MKKFQLLLFSCLFYLNASAQSATFTEMASLAGIDLAENNEGVSCADYDNDGDEDFYISVINGANRLFQNQGDESFVEVAADAGIAYEGYTFAGIWGDINNDGWLDLYLANYNLENELYLNNGDGTFSNITATAGVDDDNRAQAAMFADVNKDGFLDIYVANLWTHNVLYINNGDNTFTNNTFFAGVNDIYIAMGAIFFDYDNDNDVDLYLTHDNNEPNILYKNDGTGTFSNVSAASGMNVAGYCMGVETADFNRDGFLDVYIANLGPNYLLMNNGDGTFTETGEAAGANDGGMGWGVSCLDYDNDGWTDIYMANNSSFAPFPNILYKNMGDGTFSVTSTNTALASMRRGYGTACADINQDGSVDLMLANLSNDANELFRNEHTGNNWIAFHSIGTISNRAAIGTRIEVHTGDVQQIDEILGGSGWASQNSLNLHFGLGEATQVDSVVVRWPNGLVETYYDVEINQKHELVEAEAPLALEPEIEEGLTEKTIHFELYPNPVQDFLNISYELKRKADVQISLINHYGQTIKRHTIKNQAPNHYSLEWEMTDNLPNGVYTLHFQMNKKYWIEKIVILK